MGVCALETTFSRTPKHLEKILGGSLGVSMYFVNNEFFYYHFFVFFSSWERMLVVMDCDVFMWSAGKGFLILNGLSTTIANFSFIVVQKYVSTAILLTIAKTPVP